MKTVDGAAVTRRASPGRTGLKRVLLLLVCFAATSAIFSMQHASDVGDYHELRVTHAPAATRRLDGGASAVADRVNKTPVDNGASPTSAAAETVVTAKTVEGKGAQRSPLMVQPLLPASVMALLNRQDSMVDLAAPRVYDRAACPVEPNENELGSNLVFLDVFMKIFREKFDNLPWMLDEGGLIGASRAGAMRNADDDFDFFAVLPNNHAPCRPDSLTCTPEEFHTYIHAFLMVFWNLGMCINKFHPDKAKFVSKMRLMYSFQLNRPEHVDPLQCFIESKPFAHMHLGMFTSEGLLQTNIWAVHTTHARDKLPIEVLLPTSRCRVGNKDAPCPRNITEFLTIRNGGEYRKKSSDGSCLLVKKKWKPALREVSVEKTRQLDRCGYNTIVDLVPSFVASGYQAC